MNLKGLIILFLLGIGLSTFAQKGYADSIKAFQAKYISELEPIIKKDTSNILFYPINSRYKLKAIVTMLYNQPVFKMTTSSGKTKEAQKYALITFSIGKKKHQLYAYQLLALKEKAETASLFFVPFLDKTSGNTSYGGGRYIDFDIKDIINNKLLLDFNKAYNPYCAFTTGYNCPVPPRENLLPIPIKAGESYKADAFTH